MQLRSITQNTIIMFSRYYEVFKKGTKLEDGTESESESKTDDNNESQSK